MKKLMSVFFVALLLSACVPSQEVEVEKLEETAPSPSTEQKGSFTVLENDEEENIESDEVSQEEEEFNNSGRAKAILDEDDMLPIDESLANLENNSVMLNGLWRSADDADSTLEFKEGVKISYYAGEPMSEASFQLCLDQECETVNSDGNFIKTIEEEGDSLKYEITKLNSESLELIYLGKGNILRYNRIK